MSIDYKNTINLPQTSFAMKADLAKREPGMLAEWEKVHRYQQIQERTADREHAFILHDGPPYANGAIHLGHAVNKILKDIVVKSKLMSGLRSPYVPGWDCHGLPIEVAVEKKVGKVGQKVDADEFRKLCREYAAKQIDLQREDFKRLGVLGDWMNPYRTMDFQFEADIVRALAKVYRTRSRRARLQAGALVFRLRLGAGRSGDRISRQEIAGDRCRLRRARSAGDRCEVRRRAEAGRCRRRADLDDDAVDAAGESGGHRSGPISNTRSSKVRARGEHALYLLVAADAGRTHRCALRSVAIAACSADKTLPAATSKISSCSIRSTTARFRSSSAITCRPKKAPAPSTPRRVTASKTSTSARNTACRVLNPVGPNGVYLPDTEIFGNQYIWKANPVIVDLLRDRGVLLAAEEITHSYPHCWRHRTPVIFRATPQWFISMEEKGLREGALKAIHDDVDWYPAWGEERIAEHDRRPSGLVHLAPAHVGRADHVLRPQIHKYTASAHGAS